MIKKVRFNALSLNSYLSLPLPPFSMLKKRKEKKRNKWKYSTTLAEKGRESNARVTENKLIIIIDPSFKRGS